MSSYYTCTDCGRLYRLNITKDPDNMTVYVCRKCGEMICKDCLERAGQAAPLAVCPRCGAAVQWKPEWAVYGRALGNLMADFINSAPFNAPFETQSLYNEEK